MNKNDIAITVKDLHVYYRDMNRFSFKKSGLKGRGSGKIFSRQNPHRAVRCRKTQ